MFFRPDQTHKILLYYPDCKGTCQCGRKLNKFYEMSRLNIKNRRTGNDNL